MARGTGDDRPLSVTRGRRRARTPGSAARPPTGAERTRVRRRTRRRTERGPTPASCRRRAGHRPGRSTGAGPTARATPVGSRPADGAGTATSRAGQVLPAGLAGPATAAVRGRIPATAPHRPRAPAAGAHPTRRRARTGAADPGVGRADRRPAQWPGTRRCRAERPATAHRGTDAGPPAGRPAGVHRLDPGDAGPGRAGPGLDGTRPPSSTSHGHPPARAGRVRRRPATRTARRRRSSGNRPRAAADRGRARPRPSRGRTCRPEPSRPATTPGGRRRPSTRPERQRGADGAADAATDAGRSPTDGRPVEPPDGAEPDSRRRRAAGHRPPTRTETGDGSRLAAGRHLGHGPVRGPGARRGPHREGAGPRRRAGRGRRHRRQGDREGDRPQHGRAHDSAHGRAHDQDRRDRTRRADGQGARPPARRSRADSETDDGPEERLRADRIDETLTRLTAAHAGLVLGRYDETDDEDDEDEDDDTRHPGRAPPSASAATPSPPSRSCSCWPPAWAGSGAPGSTGRSRRSRPSTSPRTASSTPSPRPATRTSWCVATDSGGSAGATTRANTVTVVHRDARGDRTVAVTLPPRLEITRPPCERWDPAAAAYLGQTVPAEPRTTFDSAYAVGGPRCATRAAQQVTGLAITRFVAVDLAATSALVEAVGGVQVCVEQPVLDSVLGPVVATAGTDAFNGARAATLVRAADVRGEPAGGAALVQRQQRVLAAALERALSPTALLHPGRVEPPAARAGHRGRVDGHGGRGPARAVERSRRGARGADRAAGEQPGQRRDAQDRGAGAVHRRADRRPAAGRGRGRGHRVRPGRRHRGRPQRVGPRRARRRGRGHPRRPGLPHRGGAERGPARARHRRPLLPGPSGTGSAARRRGAVGERGARSRHHRGAAARAGPVVRRHGPRLHRPGGSRRRSAPHRPRPAAERRPPFTGGSPAAPAPPERRN